MPGEVYRGYRSIPDQYLEGYRGIESPAEIKSRITNGVQRDLFSQMLQQMAVNGDNPTDYLIRLSERREQLDGRMHYGGDYGTIVEIHAVPISQARALIGR